ncbi:MAG: M48 family metalloprotease [Armatimonadetes bacterium]|nr:M48 family metalloprotease [Armatimonadota bacterium]
MSRASRCVLALCVLNACCSVPARADLETALEKIIGRQAATVLSEQYGSESNPVLVEWVRRIGGRVSAASPRRDVKYRFQIIEMNEPNALALPGGYILVTKGLLEFVNDDDELAAILAHEVGHVAARHAVEQARHQVVAALLISTIRKQAGDGAGTAASLMDALFALRHSRHDELESDRLGAEYAARSGYDPAGLVAFFEKLRNSKKPSLVSRFLATHPPADARIARLKEIPFLKETPPEVLLAIGDRLAAECRYNKALARYSEAAKQRPGDAAVTARIAGVLLAQGKRAEALSLRLSAGLDAPAEAAPPPDYQRPDGDSEPARQAVAAVLGDLGERQRQLNRLLPEVQKSLRKTWARHRWTGRLEAASLGAPQGLNYRWLALAMHAVVLSREIDRLIDGVGRAARIAPGALQQASSVCTLAAKESGTAAAFPRDLLSSIAGEMDSAGRESLESMAEARKALPELDAADRLVASVLAGLNSAYLASWNTHWGHLAVLEGFLEHAGRRVGAADAHVLRASQSAARSRARAERAAIDMAAAVATPRERAVFRGLLCARLGASEEQADDALAQGYSLGEAAVMLLYARSTSRPAATLAAARRPNATWIETAEKLGVPADVQGIILRMLRRSIEEERIHG